MQGRYLAVCGDRELARCRYYVFAARLAKGRLGPQFRGLHEALRQQTPCLCSQGATDTQRHCGGVSLKLLSASTFAHQSAKPSIFKNWGMSGVRDR